MCYLAPHPGECSHGVGVVLPQEMKVKKDYYSSYILQDISCIAADTLATHWITAPIFQPPLPLSRRHSTAQWDRGIRPLQTTPLQREDQKVIGNTRNYLRNSGRGRREGSIRGATGAIAPLTWV